jgi:hypothetical protein
MWRQATSEALRCACPYLQTGLDDRRRLWNSGNTAQIKYGLLYDELFDNFVFTENAESWEDFRGWSNERCETFRPFPWLEVHMAELQNCYPQSPR